MTHYIYKEPKGQRFAIKACDLHEANQKKMKLKGINPAKWELEIAYNEKVVSKLGIPVVA